MLRRGTEFSKQKYHTGGIFRKFVVAGDGFISLCFIGCGFLRVAQTGAFQSPNPCTEPPLFGGSNPTQHTYLTKKHPQGMSFVKSWLCSVCSSRAELLEIGREIDSLKDKLCIKLHD